MFCYSSPHHHTVLFAQHPLSLSDMYASGGEGMIYTSWKWYLCLHHVGKGAIHPTPRTALLQSVPDESPNLQGLDSTVVCHAGSDVGHEIAPAAVNVSLIPVARVGDVLLASPNQRRRLHDLSTPHLGSESFVTATSPCVQTPTQDVCATTAAPLAIPMNNVCYENAFFVPRAQPVSCVGMTKEERLAHNREVARNRKAKMSQIPGGQRELVRRAKARKTLNRMYYDNNLKRLADSCANVPSRFSQPKRHDDFTSATERLLSSARLEPPALSSVAAGAIDFQRVQPRVC